MSTVKDRIHTIPIEPHFSMEFIAGIAHALSDETGEVQVEIRSERGKPAVRLRRINVDQSLPVFLRKQGE